MAYTRKRRPAKRTYRKKKSSGITTGKAFAHLGGRALKILKSQLGLNTESKYLDTVTSTTCGAATLTAFQNPIIIPQGLTTVTRIGDSLRLTRMNIRGFITHNAADTAGQLVRILITYQPKSPGASILAASDMLQDVTNVNSPLAQNLSGLTVLWDKTFMTSTNVNPIQTFKYKYAPLNHHIRWGTGDTTGAQAALEEGCIRIFTLSHNGVNTDSCAMYTRVYYVDN